MKQNKRKLAFGLSICLFLIWWALGTGATLAWFSDIEEVRNRFRIGILNMDVSYRNDIVEEYTPRQATTKAFNDQALYEPGYTQVVYLKIDNQGDLAFNYKIAVTIEGYTNGKNAQYQDIYLPDYLRYGVVFGKTEAEVETQVSERLTARANAPYEWSVLDTWSEPAPYAFQPEEESHYAALIVYMPEEVGNIANYRGTTRPEVKLGITVFAQQENAPFEENTQP